MSFSSVARADIAVEEEKNTFQKVISHAKRFKPESKGTAAYTNRTGGGEKNKNLLSFKLTLDCCVFLFNTMGLIKLQLLHITGCLGTIHPCRIREKSTACCTIRWQKKSTTLLLLHPSPLHQCVCPQPGILCQLWPPLSPPPPTHHHHHHHHHRSFRLSLSSPQTSSTSKSAAYVTMQMILASSEHQRLDAEQSRNTVHLPVIDPLHTLLTVIILIYRADAWPVCAVSDPCHRSPVSRANASRC